MSKTYEKTCKNCGNKFIVDRNNKNRSYCCDDCRAESLKNQLDYKKENHIYNRVQVVCEICGKVEYVMPSRLKKYHTCSIECRAKLSSKNLSKKIDTACVVCGKPLSLKPVRLARLVDPSHITCSKDCSNKLKETTYLGENNNQFGKKGRDNDSFLEKDLIRKNHKLTEIFVYNEDLKSRITKHRNLVIENKDSFDPGFFDTRTNLLKPGVQVHHKNLNHNDNRVENLVLLSRAKHTSLHNSIKSESVKTLSSIIGVLKQHKLLETDINLDQQSIDKIDSETITVTENIKEKDIIKEIVSKISDYIVQLENITNEACSSSLEEFKEIDTTTNNAEDI